MLNITKMKIFIDIGAYDGMSAEFFRKYHPQQKEYQIFSFECDRRNLEILRDKAYELKIHLVEKAAWHSDGTMKYFHGKDDGGSMFSTKNTGGIDPERYYQVETVDIGRFIQRHCKQTDYIILKLNAEGAEYSIIPHLKKLNLIPWINTWFVQWHWEKIGLSLALHEKVVRMLPEWHPWECQLGTTQFVNKFLNAL